MSVVSAIRRMLDAGLSVEQALIAAEACEAEMMPVRSKGAERQARYRANKASQNVTRDDSDASDDAPDPPFPSPKPPTKSPLTPQPTSNDVGTVCDFFDEFWGVYPKREGDNPKKPAKLAYSRALKRGIKPEKLLAGAKALAAKHPTPTPFVPQAATWINQDRCLDMDTTGPPPTAVARFKTVEEIFAEVDARHEKGSHAISGH